MPGEGRLPSGDSCGRKRALPFLVMASVGNHLLFEPGNTTKITSPSNDSFLAHFGLARFIPTVSWPSLRCSSTDPSPKCFSGPRSAAIANATLSPKITAARLPLPSPSCLYGGFLLHLARLEAFPHQGSTKYGIAFASVGLPSGSGRAVS